MEMEHQMKQQIGASEQMESVDLSEIINEKNLYNDKNM